MALRETDLTKQVRRRGAASQLGAHWSVRWAARGSLAAGLAQGLANAAWAEEAGPTLAPVVVTGTAWAPRCWTRPPACTAGA